MLLNKNKKSPAAKGNRILITVNVISMVRFVVNENELVVSVIDMVLKSYAREGRLPVLGSDLNVFFLYCPVVVSEGLSPLETIGHNGCRTFMLCKKPRSTEMASHENPAVERTAFPISRRGSWS